MYCYYYVPIIYVTFVLYTVPISNIDDNKKIKKRSYSKNKEKRKLQKVVHKYLESIIQSIVNYLKSPNTNKTDPVVGVVEKHLQQNFGVDIKYAFLDYADLHINPGAYSKKKLNAFSKTAQHDVYDPILRITFDQLLKNKASNGIIHLYFNPT